MTKPRAILSVSDKAGITDLGRALVDRGWEVLSTGGTARALRDAGVSVTDVADVTRHPEMMDGRVKTLHPAIHAGLLARRDRDDDRSALAEQGYQAIDLVVVNLYPFRETVARGGVEVGEAMGKVDIGGPTMIRAAAKNHKDVWVVVDPSDYRRLLGALDGDGTEDEGSLRRELAAKVFEHVSGYDAAIAAYLEGDGAEGGEDEGAFGATFSVTAHRVQALRYGENPDQEAAFFAEGDTREGIADLAQHHGKALSYNNLLDVDGALLSLAPFAYSAKPAVCIVKHTTPCGLAVAPTLVEAYRRALATDPVSAFGSVIALNRKVDAATGEAIAEHFVECVVAPGFDEEALGALTAKKNIRLLTFEGLAGPLASEPSEGAWTELDEDVKRATRFVAGHARSPIPRSFRSVYGGVLAQQPPVPPFYGVEGSEWKIVTRRRPTDQEWDDLRFAWAAVYGVKSNAILLAKDGATLGIGAGQMSRVDSSRIAVMKAADAGLDLEGSVLASDAFFPFRDGVDAAAEAGVAAIAQPGGSIRDDEVVAAADELGLAMVLTGRRLFRH